jgi:hypothetical protein
VNKALKIELTTECIVQPTRQGEKCSISDEKRSPKLSVLPQPEALLSPLSLCINESQKSALPMAVQQQLGRLLRKPPLSAPLARKVYLFRWENYPYF